MFSEGHSLRSSYRMSGSVGLPQHSISVQESNFQGHYILRIDGQEARFRQTRVVLDLVGGYI